MYTYLWKHVSRPYRSIHSKQRNQPVIILCPCYKIKRSFPSHKHVSQDRRYPFFLKDGFWGKKIKKSRNDWNRLIIVQYHKKQSDFLPHHTQVFALAKVWYLLELLQPPEMMPSCHNYQVYCEKLRSCTRKSSTSRKYL
jgi:hypothetical protein